MSKTVTKYDYRSLKAEFIAADPPVSIRELCSRNGLPESSAIRRRALAEDWVGLRDRKIQHSEELAIEVAGALEARKRVRRLEVELNAIEAIDESISKMRVDMKRTRLEKNPRTGEYETVPAVTYRPSEVVQLIDRLKGLFGVPDQPQAPPQQGDPSLAASFNFNFDGDSAEHRALAAQLVAATRGAGGPARRSAGGSPLPTAPGAGPDE